MSINAYLRFGQHSEKADPDRFGNACVRVRGTCTTTGEPYITAPIPISGFYHWALGAHIQEAMPRVSADDREFLLTGTSPKGWDVLFPKDTCRICGEEVLLVELDAYGACAECADTNIER